MKALIDPRFDRVCEVAQEEFSVATPLFWTPCQDDCIPDFDYWNASSKQIVYPPRVEPEEAPVIDLVGTTVEEF